MLLGSDPRAYLDIDRIIDKAGNVIYQTPVLESEVITPSVAHLMRLMLAQVIDRGTAASLRSEYGFKEPGGGKTGTTNDGRDVWFIGFSPDLVAGVYLGFDQPRSLGAKATGGRLSAPIFRDFMLAALKDRPALPFRIPPGVQLVEVDLDSGCLPSPSTRLVILEAFKPGTGPADTYWVIGSDLAGGSPEEMRAYVESEINKWRRLVEARKIEKQ